MILVDTNIWGRVAEPSASQHALAMKSLQWALRNGPPAMAAQSLYEFWVVATRPRDKNGLGWSTGRAEKWILACRRVCQFLPEDKRVYDTWLDLVTTHSVSGKPAHDARLAAVMRVYGINSVLTFNAGDFKRFGLQVVDPASLP